MKFGLSTLTRGLLTTREAYQAIAKAAERAGFDFLSVSDHISCRPSSGRPTPIRLGGAFAAAEHGHCLDQLATIAFLAGCHRTPAPADLGAGRAASPADA